ncbi:DnaD domain-containing protein [Bacillus sp. FJAT-45037]|uniref:DnaD domain-containing protein n=1 Tax=Bacillus sp. FJAT-45037 TaxID=2011007 RepID=UPI000C23020F|nr:DnaD domain-containing protein [Bacillus sp. FJAT-45037]
MNQKFFLQWMKQKQVTIPVLLMEHYAELGLNEREFMGVLHVQTFIEQGELFPTPDLLSRRMSLSMNECAELLGNLIKKGYVSLDKKWGEDGVIYEYFSLDPIWEKLANLLFMKESNGQEKENEEKAVNLYQVFEREFSRPLSPIEAETLSMWIDQDQHTPELIVGALRESVVSGKLNFRYIDRILFEWKRNGIKTIAQAKAHGEKFRKHQQPKKPERTAVKSDGFPSFSWLEN